METILPDAADGCRQRRSALWLFDIGRAIGRRESIGAVGGLDQCLLDVVMLDDFPVMDLEGDGSAIAAPSHEP